MSYSKTQFKTKAILGKSKIKLQRNSPTLAKKIKSGIIHGDRFGINISLEKVEKNNSLIFTHLYLILIYMQNRNKFFMAESRKIMSGVSTSFGFKKSNKIITKKITKHE